MNIDKILEYQKTQREYDAIEKEFKNSPIVQQYTKLKSQRKQIKTALENYQVAITSGNSKLESLSQQEREIEKEIADVLKENFESLEDKQLEFYLKNLNSFTNELDNIEREVNSTSKNIKEAQFQGKKLEESYKGIESLYRDVQAKANNYANNDIMPRLAVAKEKIANCKKSMADSDIALYDNAKAEIQSSRVFVELNGNNCSGCGMEVLENVKSKIFDTGYAKCSNCGRIIFLKK